MLNINKQLAKNKRIFIGLMICGIIAFYFGPFFLLFSPKNYRDAFFADYLFSIVYEHLTEDCKSEEEKVVACYKFVRDEIAMPPKDIIDGWNIDVFTRGWGYCSQQAKVLMLLVEKGDFEANLIHLYGDYPVSHHTVCEIKIDGKYRMFDPSMKVILLDKMGTLASLEEIEKGAIEPLDTILHPGITNDYYLSLYTAAHPYKIHLKNAPNKKIDIWYFLHRKMFLAPYLNLYFWIDGTSQQEQLRIKEKLNPNIKSIDTTPKLLVKQLEKVRKELGNIKNLAEKELLQQEQKELFQTLIIH